MATLTQLKSKANPVLTTIWDALATRQEAYRTKNDKYFQLTASAPVVDGQDTVLTINHPSDEKFQTDVQFNFASPVPFQIQVDEWGNNTEKGFKATVIIELLDGRKFTRSRSLTDTRVRKRDITATDADGFPSAYGDWYLEGSTPVITTTDWVEIIEN